MSGLKVNFHKSSLFGLNLQEDFLAVVASFLSCSIGAFPFKFLGISVGANPMRICTWNLVLERLRKRLSS